MARAIIGSLWIIFAILLFFAGVVMVRACGTNIFNLSFCAPSETVTIPEADRREDLLAERAYWQAELARAPQCDLMDEQALLACQPPRTDEVLLLLDASTSMLWDYPGSASAERGMAALMDQTGGQARIGSSAYNRFLQLERQLKTSPESNRIGAAQDALRAMPERMEPGTRLRLLSFAGCQAGVRDEGTYDVENANAFRSAVNGVRLRNETALASSIRELPRFTDAGRTEDRPVTIVILSDGGDSCRGDPCAAARDLKAQLPHAFVSVVSLSATPNLNRCIADATGGQFFEANDVEQLTARMRQTTGQLTPAECRALRDAEATLPDAGEPQ